MGPLNPVCGLIRFTGITASAARARSSMNSGTRCPCGDVTVPMTVVAMLLRMGAPTDASVIPRWASTDSCPSAVAPPWDPIEGTMNGSTPASRRAATRAATIRSMPAMPRLPTAMAAEALPSRVASTSGRVTAAATAATGSSRTGRGKACRTR